MITPFNKNILEILLSDLDRHRKNDIAELAHCPEGRFASCMDRGKHIYRKITTTDGIRDRKNISKQPDVMLQLLRRAYLETEIDLLEKDLNAVLHIGDKIMIPDFTLKSVSNELFYWEHCGLPGNAAYMIRHKEKLQLYESIGIVPWENLIVTYDDHEGNINMRIIENEIRCKLL